MTEHELRMLVRDAIAKQLGQSRPGAAAVLPADSPRDSVSFGLFAVPSGPEGTCIIEPSVTCNHCGYCKSYGH